MKEINFPFTTPLGRLVREMRERVSADDGRKEVTLAKDDMRLILDYLDREEWRP